MLTKEYERVRPRDGKVVVATHRGEIPSEVKDQLLFLRGISTYAEVSSLANATVDVVAFMGVTVPEANQKNLYLKVCWIIAFYQKALQRSSYRWEDRVTEETVELFKKWLPVFREREGGKKR